jgi:uracil-DNA glycosylase
VVKNLNSDWKLVLSQEFEKDYFSKLSSQINDCYSESNSINYLPEYNEIFKAFNLCTLDNLKVVIIGQDPYPNKTHAHGLCFSVKPDVKPFPKSLNNVFKEIKSDLDIDVPENGNLSRWAKQGVFLLNTILTIEEGITNSHKNIGWENFTDEVIKVISMEKENVVFLLWGSQAHKKESLIDLNKHFILKSVHPSPLSAYRGFTGCKHFSRTNTYLLENNLPQINW